MRKITLKIVIVSVITMFTASLIPNALWLLFSPNASPEEINPKMILLGAIITVLFTIMLFNFFIDRILIGRIRKLNYATKEIMKGNYNTRLQTFEQDEISELIGNFNHMSKELQSNEYLNKEFIRNFSHELKTPLSAIKGYADLISETSLSEQEINEYSNIISKEASRLSFLSKNMLQISLVDSKNIIQKTDTFNLSEQIRNVVQFMQLAWEKKQLRFDIDMEEITLQSNKEFLYQVWSNLISNAIKFTANNEVIHIELQELGDTIQFSISNQGYLSKEDIKKVFDLFFVAEEAHNTANNGVGLTLSKKIITKLGGSITVSSQENLITFTVILPTY